uniref:Reverse transcriptase domain-containing protein n=1 Tax=Cannabis sativa TaxID=3483 RepID=A0A803NH51_CANSA
MDPTGISGIFEDTIQLSSEDITFSLNPGEVDEPQESNKVLLGKIISRREDALNVLARRPWFVCGALMVLMPWPAWLTPSEIRFDKTPIWVSVDSIPPFYWNLSNLKEIAAKASPVYELPNGVEDAVGMSTLRFRATIDLNKPLFSGFFLRRQKLKDLWLQYRYDKLPKLCFKCGILTHDQSTCFKPPTVVKDSVGNFYPLYGTWLKNDSQHKCTFSTPLAKWFQDWVLQKQIGKDPKLRNQLRVEKAIRNGENDEMRESRIQLPTKRRIVSDEEEEAHDGGEPAQVITQLPLVYLPGIGEFAPYGNNNKKVVIQDLIDAAQPSNSKDTSTRSNSTVCNAQGSQHNGHKIQNEAKKVTSSGETTKYKGKKPLHNPPQEDLPAPGEVSDHNTPETKSHYRTSKDKSQVDSYEGSYSSPSYRASPLGSQTQYINWPSKECWAQPKARELFMGSLTVDKFHREPTLFNPLHTIEDFRVDEHLNGPRKRKASDGFMFSPTPKSKTQMNYEFAKIEPNSGGPPCSIQGIETPNSVTDVPPYANETWHAPPPVPFVTGHDIEGATPKRRGRPKKNIQASTDNAQPLKRRGRPPKNHSGLSANSKQFKWTNPSKTKNSYTSTIKHHWEGKTIDLKIDLDNHFVVVEITHSVPTACQIQELEEDDDRTNALPTQNYVRQLAALICRHKPEMLLLSEARIPLQKFEAICRRLHFEEVIYVPPVGFSGGLGLCWMKGVKCNINFNNKYGIMGSISSDPPGVTWHLIGIYGPLHEKDKENFWKEIGDLALSSSNPLLLIGDMNGTLLDSECINYTKQGNSARYAFDFRRMVDRAGLIDLGFIGPPFTWSESNKQASVGLRQKRARLDRSLASMEWRILFPDAILNHLSASTSDRRPILLDTSGGYKGKHHPFRYENMWARDQRCYWVVKEAWAKRLHNNPMINFHRKVKNTRQKLSHWNKNRFRKINVQIQEATSYLQDVEQSNPDDLNTIEGAQQQLSEALLREEIHWRQKSRIQWLKEGDRCSKFFMTSTIIRRRKNFIQCIKDAEKGNWIRDQKEIAECCLKNFQDLFKKDPNCCTPHLIDLFPTAITPEENLMLNAIRNPEEVMVAIAEMGKDKAPGPDGLPASFYAHHWDTISNALHEMVIHFFTHSELPHFINDTAIVLIPKNDTPVYTKDYRPIALCNVAYKIISKIIATRMRGILPKLISPTQTAFVKGRCITENTLIAREVVHSMKRKKGKRGFMMIKIDMEKAYDNLDWDFIIVVLYQMGFSNCFTSWIRACISTKEIKLLLNGSIEGKVKPEWGLRQGDPLSPTLFIIAAETLSRLIFSKEKSGALKGFKMGRNGTAVNHLMFADDIILFGQATLKEARVFKECLTKYCLWSGQSINAQKSSIHFSKGVCGGKIQAITQLLGMKRMSPDANYLGLPLFKNARRSEEYSPLVEKVLGRVKGWKTKLLSNADRACLIKSVGSSLANYLASSDAIPVSTANKIDKTLRDFWWGDTEDKRVMHTIAWERLCKPKIHGGLGFRTTKDTNMAFLMKWAWKLMVEDSSLWVKIVNAKYLRNKDFLDIEAQPADSRMWKEILNARQFIHKGICRRIGNGEETSIWFHPWVPGGDLQSEPVKDATEGISMVRNFIRDNGWNEDLIRQWFKQEDAIRILNITLPNIPEKDSWLWLPEANGQFSVKSAYRITKNIEANSIYNEKWLLIWGAKMHNRAKMMWWRVLADCLLTRNKILKAFGISDPFCPFCSTAIEDSFHLLWECSVTRAVWFGSNWNIRTNLIHVTDWDQWIRWFKKKDNRPQAINFDTILEGAAIIMERLWNLRNSVVHMNTTIPLNIVVHNINRRLAELDGKQDAQHSLQTEWLPPPTNWRMCNTDVAIGIQVSAGAAVFCDDQGTITNVFTTKLFYRDSLAGEISSLCSGAEAAVQLGLKMVIFQSDSVGAIEAVKSNSQSISTLNHNVQQLVAKFQGLTSKLDLWEINWIPRKLNGVAHDVAQ